MRWARSTSSLSRRVEPDRAHLEVGPRFRAQAAALEQPLVGRPGLVVPATNARPIPTLAHQLPHRVQELQHVIQRQSQQLGLGLELHDLTDTSVLSSIVRITGGNFRLVERLFAQIERVAQINEVATLTPELVEAAQESLVIGAS